MLFEILKALGLDIPAKIDALKANFDQRVEQTTAQVSKVAQQAAVLFSSWMNQLAITSPRLNNIPADWGTAVNVQAMVFGNMGDSSGTGVAFTRNPRIFRIMPTFVVRHGFETRGCACSGGQG